LVERLAGGGRAGAAVPGTPSGEAAAAVLPPLPLQAGVPPCLWLAFGAGGRGSFTTVSGFAFEMRGLVASGRRCAAGIYLFLSLFLGLAGAAAGWALTAG